MGDVHFLVMSIVAKYNSFLAACGLGNIDLVFVRLRNCLWYPSTVLVV